MATALATAEGRCPGVGAHGDGEGDGVVTRGELADRVCAGWFYIAGELRGATVDRAGYVDKKTGIAMQSVLITYFVELRASRGFEVVKITRRAPPEVTDPAAVTLNVEQGRVYAFPVDTLNRKAGVATAQMASAEPELIEAGELPLGAPQGAPAAAPNLVQSQTTPQHP